MICKIGGEVAGVVVGEEEGAIAIADDKELEKAAEDLGVADAGVVFVFDDLLHSPPRVDAERLQLHLHDGHAIDEEDDVVAVMAVVGVDAELVDDLEGVFAPVLNVDQGVVERRAVIADKAVDLAEGAGGGEDVGVMISSSRRENSPSVRVTRLRASSFWRKLASSVARSWMSRQTVYLRSRSFWMKASSMPFSLRTKRWCSGLSG